MRRLMLLLVLILTAVSLMACGGAEPTAVAPAADPVTDPTAEPIAEPTAPTETEPASATSDQLVIYSGRSDSLVQPVIDQFKEATGIDVQVRYGSTSEMAGVLLEEGANSPADLFFAQDPGGLGAVQNAGLLAPLPAELLANVAPRFVAESGEWVGVSGRARVVAYNTTAITDPANQLPADIFDFVDEEWNGRIGWAPSNGSFQAMVTAMRSTWGEEKTREWLAGIQANNPVVYDGNTPIVAGVAAGEVEVGFVNHYYLYRFLAEEGEGFAARNYFLPGGGPGSLIMVSGAGILKTAPNAANAQRFIEYLLSPEGQQYFTNETFEYPVIADVATVEGLPPLADLDAIAANISLSDLADLEGTQELLLELGIIE
jgi:iron(III) transport system substrate-binding protein